MILNLRLIKVNSDYCDYLRKFDNKISYNKGEKELRPFVGILFTTNDCEYFAPLSIPKPKHLKMKNTIDFFKIKNGELGAVNFNNMIPVKNNNYELIDLDKDTLTLTLAEEKYQRLLKQQLNWLNENYIQVKNKSHKLYTLYINNKLSKNIKSRCCNFPLLREKCAKYNDGVNWLFKAFKNPTNWGFIFSQNLHIYQSHILYHLFSYKYSIYQLNLVH